MTTIFYGFLVGLVGSLGDIHDFAANIEAPSGTLFAPVLHVLNYPSKKLGQAEFAKLLDDKTSPCLQLLKAIFPDLRKHMVMDLSPLRKHIHQKNKNKRRRTSEEDRDNDPATEACYDYARAMIEESKALVIILYGNRVRRWFEAEFGKSKHVTIACTQRTVIFVNHPEHILRWITPEDAVTNYAAFEELIKLGLKINLAKLHWYIEKTLQDLKDQEIDTLEHDGDGDEARKLTMTKAEAYWEEVKANKDVQNLAAEDTTPLTSSPARTMGLNRILLDPESTTLAAANDAGRPFGLSITYARTFPNGKHAKTNNTDNDLKLAEAIHEVVQLAEEFSPRQLLDNLYAMSLKSAKAREFASKSSSKSTNQAAQSGLPEKISECQKLAQREIDTQGQSAIVEVQKLQLCLDVHTIVQDAWNAGNKKAVSSIYAELVAAQLSLQIKKIKEETVRKHWKSKTRIGSMLKDFVEDYGRSFILLVPVTAPVVYQWTVVKHGMLRRALVQMPNHDLFKQMCWLMDPFFDDYFGDLQVLQKALVSAISSVDARILPQLKHAGAKKRISED